MFQAFFAKDYIMNHPEDGDKISRLRELMFEQVCLKKPDLFFIQMTFHAPASFTAGSPPAFEVQPLFCQEIL